MADPKVKVTVEADGKKTKGTLRPSAGTTLQLMFADAARAVVGFDYTEPNMLALRVGGDVRVRVGKKDKLRAEGDLEKSLRTGTFSFDGAMTMQFSKQVSVKVDTALTKAKQKVGLKLTLEFE